MDNQIAELNEEYSSNENTPSGSTARIVYILYLVGLVFGLTALIGVIMAHVNKDKPENPDWLNSHYQFQIRTFWYGVIYLMVGVILSLFLIGYLILLWWVIWLIIRMVKGFSALDARKPMPSPTAFFGFGD